MAALVLAADAVTGKWTYEMQGRGGGGGGTPRVVTLDLKAAGSTLTGTVLQPRSGRGGGGGEAPAPQPAEIKNGKVEGNNVSFEVTRETPMGPTTTKYAGTVSGDTMKLKVTREGQNGPQTSEVTAKRSTP